MLSYFADEAVKAIDKHIKEYKNAGKHIYILCDTNTQEHCLPLLQNFLPFPFVEGVFTMKSGEKYKNIETATDIWQQLLDKNADKSAVLLCLGGGVVCDIGGFTAATFKRGIDYLFVPTSLTAQIDACIGGKTAINFKDVKNQIGLFHLPDIVFTIPAFLDTLPEKEIFSGFAEMLKHGLIADKSYWEELIKVSHSSQIIKDEFIKKSINIKTNICNTDPYEKDERRKLNFGHTIGHSLESFALSRGFSLSHGEAVAMGMMAETHISYQKHMISEEELNTITAALQHFFPLFPVDKKNYKQILSFLQKDKKRMNESLNFTLLDKIGKAIVGRQVENEEIILALETQLTK